MKSRIYKEVGTNELQKIVNDLYGNNTDLLEYRIMKGGLYNTTYFAKTKYGEIVIRIGPVNTHLLFDFEKDMMAAEPYFHALLHEKGIPTSTVLKYSAFGEVIDREYIISEYINSIPMNDPSLQSVELSNIYEEVGAYTKLIHEIGNDRFGWIRPSGDKEKSYGKWSDFILRYADEGIAKAKEHNLFAQSDIDLLDEFIHDGTAIKLLDDIKTPKFIHTDLWTGNILLSKQGDKYKTAAIIDLDRAIFGDIYWDLTSEWMINESFLKGYGKTIEKTPGVIKRGEIYGVVGGFFGVYVVLIEYDDQNWYENFKKGVVSSLHAMCGKY